MLPPGIPPTGESAAEPPEARLLHGRLEESGAPAVLLCTPTTLGVTASTSGSS